MQIDEEEGREGAIEDTLKGMPYIHNGQTHDEFECGWSDEQAARAG